MNPHGCLIQFVTMLHLGQTPSTISSRVLAQSWIPAGAPSSPVAKTLDLRTIFNTHTPSRTLHVMLVNGRIVGTDGDDEDEWMVHVQWAKHCHEQNVQINLGIDGRQVFRTLRPINEGEPLVIWFSVEAAKGVGIPFLAPVNIQGRERYVCHLCNRIFTDPNPLKVHLAFLCPLMSSTLRPPFLVPFTPSPPSPWPTTFNFLPPPLPPSILSPVDGETAKSRCGHKCVYCGKLYSRKYGLKIHIRTHTGYKPLKCRVCFRPFGDPSNLNKHVRLHAQGNTPYRCEECGKVLVRRRDLERHIRARHPSNDIKVATNASTSNVTKDEPVTLKNSSETK